jgi:MoaE-MoaD fusion protein
MLKGKKRIGGGAMKLKLLLFAGLAEQLGGPAITITIDEKEAVTVADLKARLLELYPDAARSLELAFVAVNQAYAEPTQRLSENDEIALLPPVSGGQPAEGELLEAAKGAEPVQITYEPISVEEVTRKVIHPNHGASLAFVGTTREYTYGQRTVLLEYEAYAPMALRTMQQICDEIAEQWEGALCAITHRLGSVAIGEISVVIAVSAPHRAAVYEASRYAIERLKQIVPIWKKEIWEDGSEWKGHQQGPWDPTAAPVPDKGEQTS